MTAATPTQGTIGSLGPRQDAEPDDYKFHYTPTHPNPWLSLAQAGFAMAAGKSPHALENIGAGAEHGLASYVQQQQEANKENIGAGEAQARIADTAAYRQGMLGYRNKQADTAETNAVNRFDLGNRTLELRQQGLDQKTASDQAKAEALQIYRQWQQTHGNATLEERQQADAWRRAQGLTEEDIRQRGQDITARGQIGIGTPMPARVPSTAVPSQGALASPLAGSMTWRPTGGSGAPPAPGLIGPNQRQIDYLKAHPDTAAQFNGHFGANAAQQFLNGP